MSEPGAASVIDEVRVWPAGDDPHRFVYLPGPPHPQRGPDGKPTASLIVTGEGGMLQVGASWGLEPEETERLRAKLATANRGLDAGTIVLSPAPVAVSEAVLEIADGAGGFTGLATSPGSGFPPYAAIFSAVVDAERRSLAAAALHGTPGSLRVRYRASGTIRCAATARLRGALPNAKASRDPRAAVEAAIKGGDLTIEVELADAPPELAAKARDLVVDQAAAALGRGAGGGLELEATAVADVAAALEPVADVADWFADGPTAAGHVLIAPGVERLT